jgi:phenylalanyl-tRNA synthetase alpha chain
MVDKLLGALDSLLQTSQTQLESAKTVQALEQLRVEILGKKGQLTELLKALGQLSAEERPRVGARANEVRQSLSDALEKRLAEAKRIELNSQLASDATDVSLPGVHRTLARAHPVNIVQDELVGILARCGFLVEVGPEAEHEFYNFDALNIPAHHPSRAMQDTFYVEGLPHTVLRTHTSPVQVRTMLSKKPPIRICSPGRVYRSDYDATHSPMFHQMEGLLVDRDVAMPDLKGILQVLVQEFFSKDLKVRLRPSFFPFTEPSAEVDMECVFCRSKGCKVCKQSGWVEIGGCGMVDPEVFRSVGIDPEEFRGFAFGMGLERMAMLRFGISDLRAFFESDLRFVGQFARIKP